jgi:hypothetical protein
VSTCSHLCLEQPIFELDLLDAVIAVHIVRSIDTSDWTEQVERPFFLQLRGAPGRVCTWQSSPHQMNESYHGQSFFCVAEIAITPYSDEHRPRSPDGEEQLRALYVLHTRRRLAGWPCTPPTRCTASTTSLSHMLA